MDASRYWTVDDDLALPDALAHEPPDRDASSAIAPPRLSVEQADLRMLLGYQDAWARLAANALDPNIFLDPAFALPLVQHIGPSQRPLFILVWQENDTTSFGRLVGLLPLAKRIVPGDRVARGFAHEQICLGQPLPRPRPSRTKPGRRCAIGSAPARPASRCACAASRATACSSAA